MGRYICQEGQRWGRFRSPGFCVVCCLPFLCRLPSCVSIYMVDCTHICTYIVCKSGHVYLTHVKFYCGRQLHLLNVLCDVH